MAFKRLLKSTVELVRSSAEWVKWASKAALLRKKRYEVTRVRSRGDKIQVDVRIRPYPTVRERGATLSMDEDCFVHPRGCTCWECLARREIEYLN